MYIQTDSSSAGPDSRHRKYTIHELRSIGQACSENLPPMCTVQAMCRYELQRQSKVERLFRGQLFNLVKAENASESPESRITKLEKTVNELERMVKGKVMDERLAFSNIKVDALSIKTDNLAGMLQQQATELEEIKKTNITKANAHDDKISDLATQLDVMKKTNVAKADANDAQMSFAKVKVDAHSIKIVDLTSISSKQNDKISNLAAQLEEITLANVAKAAANIFSTEFANVMTKVCEELDVLFSDRNTLVNLIDGVESRIEKLEGLVRTLTAQGNTSTTASDGASPAQTQRIPVQSHDGQSYDLSIPKGSGLGTRKENRAPIKPFTPGNP